MKKARGGHFITFSNKIYVTFSQIHNSPKYRVEKKYSGRLYSVFVGKIVHPKGNVFMSSITGIIYHVSPQDFGIYVTLTAQKGSALSSRYFITSIILQAIVEPAVRSVHNTCTCMYVCMDRRESG